MNQADIDHIKDCIAQNAAFMAELEASRYYVVTIVFRVRGAVHYTCKTKQGALDIVGENLSNSNTYYIKEHTFSDC